MGSNPINLAVRFLLELVALYAIGLWGWEQTESWYRIIFAFGLPVFFAAVWGVFAVPNDPSRSGAAPVAVNGIVRLTLEFAFFGFAIWCVYDLGHSSMYWIMGLLITAHYIISYERLKWLLKR